MNIELLRSTFNAITPRADEVATSFYAKMLGTFPQLRPLSPGELAMAGRPPGTELGTQLGSTLGLTLVGGIRIAGDASDEEQFGTLEQLGAKPPGKPVAGHRTPGTATPVNTLR